MRFLKLASNLLGRSPEAPFTWPYWIDVSVDGPQAQVAFAEGVAHGSAGGVFTLEEALSPQWRTHFERAEGEWLLPYLERLAGGGVVTETELRAAFTERHGREPEHYDWDR
ncbi:hypothetical protein [Glycomyces paridis]|uniref:Uncharacterized protein n=1 Tax=Glycomyces paridis TaxID=2126555 RepID=A0A4S8PDR7_9ACTN|nr:hypothetical protein [Glycomyces paridis]THV27332.1 hypothetical protein E9998_15890 [Glycomyces paridis]